MDSLRLFWSCVQPCCTDADVKKDEMVALVPQRMLLQDTDVPLAHPDLAEETIVPDRDMGPRILGFTVPGPANREEAGRLAAGTHDCDANETNETNSGVREADATSLEGQMPLTPNCKDGEGNLLCSPRRSRTCTPRSMEQLASPSMQALPPCRRHTGRKRTDVSVKSVQSLGSLSTEYFDAAAADPNLDSNVRSTAGQIFMQITSELDYVKADLADSDELVRVLQQELADARSQVEEGQGRDVHELQNELARAKAEAEEQARQVEHWRMGLKKLKGIIEDQRKEKEAADQRAGELATQLDQLKVQVAGSKVAAGRPQPDVLVKRNPARMRSKSLVMETFQRLNSEPCPEALSMEDTEAMKRSAPVAGHAAAPASAGGASHLPRGRSPLAEGRRNVVCDAGDAPKASLAAAPDALLGA
eukprot:TRINITY_DN27722_c1_g1_i1.p1 TRINITY_DN27722_c1_g1~~TRINITY_DN27722_c1_g1_i1.p1  ORF type:complete len:418 (+),score=102.70 TRINITY_DN27722_c1_g1_i1:51-1304(+)